MKWIILPLVRWPISLYHYSFCLKSSSYIRSRIYVSHISHSLYHLNKLNSPSENHLFCLGSLVRIIHNYIGRIPIGYFLLCISLYLKHFMEWILMKQLQYKVNAYGLDDHDKNILKAYLKVFNFWLSELTTNTWINIPSTINTCISTTWFI